jgi:hypothetical protein
LDASLAHPALTETGSLPEMIGLGKEYHPSAANTFGTQRVTIGELDGYYFHLLFSLEFCENISLFT